MASRALCYSAYTSTLKTEATFSSETSFDFQRTTCNYIPEGRANHNHRSDNIKSKIENDFVVKINFFCYNEVIEEITPV
jgi:hypothetical protein